MFGRIAGIVEWECPDCGVINRSRLTGFHHRVRCGGFSCRRRLVVGLTFYRPLPGAAHHTHSDLIPPFAHTWEPTHPNRVPARTEPDPPAEAEPGYVPARLGWRLRARNEPLNRVEDCFPHDEKLRRD